ncbi:PSD1 and planctomycete cytochrome C domain-containing protein [Rhodopirellula europaea]|uniref:PSD1 and planctomycete cytochrome C domain-containing protein n=1 Tax=Rhodopirellula europaea TaxID=1263866 RepID=UPI003D2E480C
MNSLRWYALSFLIVASVVAARADEGLSDTQVEFFESKIRPVLVEHCYECHNSDSAQEGEFALDWNEPLRTGGQTGKAIAESASNSLLLQVMRHEIEGLEMPEGGEKLSPAILADFEQWITMGAPDPRDAPPSKETLAKSTSWETIRNKRAKWWSFQPIREVPIPDLDQDWSNHPIDQFVYRKMHANGLSPSPQADRVTLIRRLHFALIGLPPTPAQIDAFVNDDSPDAYEKLVDRLLDSPHFGERWARHWMDWFRYAQSHGSEGDPPIVGADLYRDYLIRAINADVPSDQLIREHIAGDQLAQPRINPELGINESIIGTAHWRMVFHGFAPTDALDERVRFTDDAIDVVSKAVLGLTVSCARCHNHKFDAISQADYYALAGIVGSTRPARAAIDLPQRLNLHRDSLTKLKSSIRDAITADWSTAAEQVASQLQDTPANPTPSESPHDLVALWTSLQHEIDAGKSFQEAWQRRVQEHDALQERQRQYAEQTFSHHWNFADSQSTNNNPTNDWFAYGGGLADPASSDRQPNPTPPGEFSVSVDDPNAALRAIYPAGIFSGLLSDKLPGVLTSTDFRVGAGQRLWLQIAGDGQASNRYVVQNYPRNGTVYPVNNLAGPKAKLWHWQEFNLGYWQGDDAHIELATARDAPLLVKNSDRSWFGIRQAIVTAAEQKPPVDFHESLSPIFRAAESKNIQSMQNLATLYQDVIVQAIKAWQSESIDDPQALLLDACLQHNLLPNTLAQLPKTKPLIERYRQLEAEIPVATRAPTVAEWKGQDQALYVRGDHKQPGVPVPRRFLEAFDASPYQTRLSGRSQFAEDLIADENPLTTRVLVNRLWHHLFGRGIVATTDNFGRLGDQPTHPELLDYLATQFRQNGWSLKTMIRQMVTSMTWRQQSQPTETAQQLDPKNRLLSYRTTTRLDAEAIRDSLLFVSGRLQTTPPKGSVAGNSDRRSVYVRVIRNNMDPFLASFDAPVPFSCKGRRDVTNVPAQALMMLNSPFVVGIAKSSARSLLADPSLTDTPAKIRASWKQHFGREPTPAQVAAAEQFLHQSEVNYNDLGQKISRLEQQMAEATREIDAILLPARQHLIATKSEIHDADLQQPSTTGPDSSSGPRPLKEWDFQRLSESGSTAKDLKLHGSAAIQDGALIVDGNGWAASDPLPVTQSTKSLEVVVQLDDLQQTGGGAISVQTTDGVLFDAIVFAEREPQRWMSGSDHSKRTQSFQGTAEDVANTEPVHLVITYGKDGKITCYRNGQAYGKAYQTTVQSFPADRSHVIFGMRHGTDLSKGRMLKGRLFSARLYDQELSSEQVKSLAQNATHIVSRQAIVDSLSPATRDRLLTLEAQQAELQRQRDTSPAFPEPQQHWIDFTHSLINMKEFLYVR